MKKIKILSGIILIGLATLIYANTISSDLYIYEITEVNDGGVRGIAVNNKSKNNKGVFLYQDGFKVGDKISIAWGKNNEILAIKNVR